MNALLILIPITLVLAIVAVGVFFWAVNHAQFEDLDSPKVLPLLDDPPPDGAAGEADARPAQPADGGERAPTRFDKPQANR